MKKSKSRGRDELRDEYRRSDFGRLVRGKYSARVAAESNIVVIEPEVSAVFPNDEAVNRALRGLIEVAQTATRLKRPPSGTLPKKSRAR
jgi:hypothetical protein